MAITITRGVQDLRVTIPREMYGVARRAFGIAITNAHNEVMGNFSGTGTASSRYLNNRSGYLRRSIKFKLTGSSIETLNASLYSDAIYSTIHETGGIIRAKNKFMSLEGAPYLSIPLGSNKTPSGVTRQTPRAVFQGGGFIIRSRGGKYLIMDKSGVPMYVLVKQVRIPARLGMIKAVDNGIDDLIEYLRSEL